MFVNLLLVLVLIQPTCASVPPFEMQGLKAKLQAKLENYAVAANSFPQALAIVAARFEIPMGIEWIRTPVTQREIKRSWPHASVYQVLESLVKTQPGYELRITDSVVHVFPRAAPTNKSDFLNHRISNFEANNEFEGGVSARLRELLKRTVNPALPPPSGLGTAGSTATGIGDRQVSFRLVNVTVREILDELALGTDFKIWVVTYPESRTLTKTGFRRVASLYTTNPVPDGEQPVWAFLRWGDALPK